MTDGPPQRWHEPSPVDAFDAWHAKVMKQVKGLFVWVVITQLVIIVALVIWRMWAQLPVPMLGLAVAFQGRYVVYLRERGKI